MCVCVCVRVRACACVCNAPWTIVRSFDQISFNADNSSLEGAMKLKFSDFGQKPWTIIRRFYRNRGDFLQSFYSTLEGAMKLKFASFCSS